MADRRALVVVDGEIHEALDTDNLLGGVVIFTQDDEPTGPAVVANKCIWIRPADGAQYTRVPSSGGDAWFEHTPPDDPGVFPFKLADGSDSSIPLSGDDALPFYKADGSASDIPFTS